nr:MAG TPA: hypothetical protein [Caudoviricetes sp.]
MAETPYNHYALYEPDASPDLTATGEYNSAIMGIDSDMHAETAERKADTQAAREERTRIEREYKAADARLDERITTLGNQETADVRDVNAKLVQEVTDRKAADTKLDTKFTNGLNNVTNGLITVGNGVSKVESDYKAADAALIVRINNAEAEISANSADLTGIKSLTYGNEHVQFLEHDNGSYSSPALDEIAEQMGQRMACVQIPVGATTIDVASLNKINSNWPNVALVETGTDPLANGLTTTYFTYTKEDSNYCFAPIGGQYGEEGGPYTQGISIAKTGEVSRFNIENDPYWANVQLKPFSTIGSGLKVESDALTLDASALPSGLTIMHISEFGELTYEDAHPYSASGEGDAAAYAKLQQAWPNVVVVDATTTWTGGMYTPASWKQNGYTLTKSTIDSTTHGTPVSMTVNGSGYSDAVRLKEIVATGITADTQWGTIEA